MLLGDDAGEKLNPSDIDPRCQVDLTQRLESSAAAHLTRADGYIREGEKPWRFGDLLVMRACSRTGPGSSQGGAVCR